MLAARQGYRCRLGRNVTYYFTVVAYDNEGDQSPPSM